MMAEKVPASQAGFLPIPVAILGVIVLFVGIQLVQYSQDLVYSGGDWNYMIKCPLGTSSHSLNQGPLAGEMCQPYLAPVFNKIFDGLSSKLPWWIPLPTQYKIWQEMKTNQISANQNPTDETAGPTDRTVWVAVDQIGQSVNIYYFDKKQLPKTLDDLETITDISPSVYSQKNPFTGKAYIYEPKSDGSGFTINGELKNGEIYKKFFPLK